MLLAVGIIVGSQFADVKTAHAELEYAFSYNGLDYYVDTESSHYYTKQFFTTLECFQGSTKVHGEIVAILLDYDDLILKRWSAVFFFTYEPQNLVVYNIAANNSGIWGDFSLSVYNIYQRNLEKLKTRIEQHNRKVEAKFNSLIAEGDNAYINKDYSSAVQSYGQASKIDKSSVDKFVSELIKNGDNLTSQKNLPAALDYYKKSRRDES